MENTQKTNRVKIWGTGEDRVYMLGKERRREKHNLSHHI